MYYVKATGDNRYGQGTDKWLKIRNVVKKNNDVYEIEVYFKEMKHKSLISLSRLNNIDMIFSKGWELKQPVSFHDVLKGWGFYDKSN
jgi:hypothetical protein